MSDKAFVFITGLAGPHPLILFWNGLYNRTSETFGGYPVYVNRIDRGMCIVHRNGNWELKCSIDKESDEMILAWVKGGCPLENYWRTTAHFVWKLLGDEGFIDQPSVKIVLGEEGERQVR
jgi:hypothetical protein